LRLIGFGEPTDFFVPDSKPGFYRTNWSFTTPFIPSHFGVHPLSFRLPKHKEANTVRIFVLGESAALGDPAPSFGFSAQLQAQLRAHYPGKRLEVYNLGIVAINSHVVYQIVREITGFEPDLLVIYMGNNEVVGPYGPGCFYLSSMPPLAVIRASLWAHRTRLGQLISAILQHVRGKGPPAQAWRGIEAFLGSHVRGNDPRLDAVYNNFYTNLQDSVACAGRAGIKVVLSTLVANYKDFSPFVSLHRANLSPVELRAFQSAFEEGMLAWNLDDHERALAKFTSALELDPEFADVHYMLGKIEEERGNRDQARKHFVGALHWDALRFRPDAPINEIIRKVARAHRDTVFLVDAAKEMGADPAAPGRPSGREILFEHVHFNWEGNYQLARSLAETCARALSPRGDAGPPWLDSTQCAATLGCTDYEKMMTRIRVFKLIWRQPFASQSSYGEELARLGREIKLAHDRIEAAGGVALEQEKEEQALRRDPHNPDFVSRRVTLEFNLEHFEHALQLIDQARALVPESPYIFVMQKAAVLQQLNRDDEAEKLLLDQIQSHADDSRAIEILVEIWSKTGQFEKGRAFFTHLLQQSPGNDQLRLEFGTLLQLSGDFQGAASEWLTVFKHDPGNEEALKLLVQSYQHLGEEETAVALMQKAQGAQPYNIENYRRLAEISMKQGDQERTVKLLKSMSETNPVDAAFHLDLAHRYLELNRPQQVCLELEKAKPLARIEENEALVKKIDSLLHICAREQAWANPVKPAPAD